MTRLELRLPMLDAERAALAAAFLALDAPQGWQEQEDADGVTFTVHYESEELAKGAAEELQKRLPEATLSLTVVDDDTDWSSAWKQYFTPIAAGQLFEVLPPWLVDEADPNRKPIVIEPKMAFGTGHHPTTALCLEAIGELVQAGRLKPSMRFLDLGTGSGILAIAMAMTGLTGVALDIDPQAVACARENLVANQVAEAVRLDVGSADALPEEGPFDCVLANILSKPLIAMAPRLAPRLASDGCLVLSGILDEQAAEVIAAYEALGLGRPRTVSRDEWVALVWDKSQPV